MKILQILGEAAWDGRVAGVHATTRALIRRGNEVSVVVDDDGAASRFELIGAQVLKPPVWSGSLHPLDIVPFAHLVAVCRRTKFDLVITYTAKAGLLGRLAARLAGVPHIVHHTYAYQYHRFAPGAHRSLWLGLEKLAARAGDLTVATSADLRSCAIRDQVDTPERILMVPDGVSTHQFGAADRAAVRRELGFPAKTRLLGAFLALESGTGCEELLKAMPTVLARHLSSRLVIVGDGSRREEYRQEAALMGLSDRVRFLRPHTDSSAWLPAFDIVVQPSMFPRDPIPLLEAMGAGCAVVACNTSLNRELLNHGQTALLVPPDNARALGIAISHLLDDPSQLQTIGERARSDTMRRFSLNRMVE
ncbi:MAG: glycosyltransferase family 4 protein, partial [bacterium]|nr:glycosyltransferase family 4 protein [bacterium]